MVDISDRQLCNPGMTFAAGMHRRATCAALTQIHSRPALRCFLTVTLPERSDFSGRS